MKTRYKIIITVGLTSLFVGGIIGIIELFILVSSKIGYWFMFTIPVFYAGIVIWNNFPILIKDDSIGERQEPENPPPEKRK